MFEDSSNCTGTSSLWLWEGSRGTTSNECLELGESHARDDLDFSMPVIGQPFSTLISIWSH